MGFMQKLLLCLKTNSRDKFLRLVPYGCTCDSAFLSFLPSRQVTYLVTILLGKMKKTTLVNNMIISNTSPIFMTSSRLPIHHIEILLSFFSWF